MFDRILVANRGEIACRVMRTARRLGIATVAIYSDADRGALHVREADSAMRVGPAAARQSYLDIAAVIDAARRSGAQAIHPGYGFLSENAAFAEACAQAGLVFVGPPAAAIRAMGDKSAAKAAMERAGVPVVPGYHGVDQDDRVFAAHAERIGYPLLVKAAAGGGGKGMRVVGSAPELDAALAGARREAASAFGDDRLLVERYLQRPRHIEIQVFADAHGGCVHLFERDCSLQRRHQKVIEEAPAPGMTAARRAQMGEAAIRAARAVGYVGAGTVEFIADQDGGFYFMEMNTRLQVEHPVTEMVTGLDLVEWQLRVAAGSRLPLAQSQIELTGHAFEARIYAEDPQRDFLPAGGRLAAFVRPPEGTHVRLDAGVAAGDAIAVEYDPMIAKLIVRDADRDAALARLRGALAATRIAGAITNLDFLRRVAAHPAFAAGAAEIDTGFIARHRAALVPAPGPIPDATLACAAVAVLSAEEPSAAAAGDPWSPWAGRSGWRLGGVAPRVLEFAEGETRCRVEAVASPVPGEYELALPAGKLRVRSHPAAHGHMRIDLDGHVCEASVTMTGASIAVDDGTQARRLTLVDPLAAADGEEESGGRFAAPMPGKLVAVRCAAGERVSRGQVLVVLEAMKMEHAILAPSDGTVESVRYKQGDQVAEGSDLLVFRPAS
ncbi:MAG: acetyl-CoA carboxylase biotin carboxylase subunit [Rhodospirillales bacterium]|jgi:3-methylcrotonyl-CoA carboxylase alpha subunit